jgi:hypothetical protein
MFSTLFVWTALLFASSKGFAHALAIADDHVSTHTPANSLNKLASVMPRSALAKPAGELKYVVLGLGTQNYTCVPGEEHATPSTTGATGTYWLYSNRRTADTYKATLYDIGSRLSTNLLAATWRIPAISRLALVLSAHPEALEGYLQLEGFDRVVGHHFFSVANGKSSPVFAFDQLSSSPYPVAQVGKADETDAPKHAYPGLQHEGAVPWLYLTDTGFSVGGIDTVYRLETAGGKGPASCQGQAARFEVKYAAQCEHHSDVQTVLSASG